MTKIAYFLFVVMISSIPCLGQGVLLDGLDSGNKTTSSTKSDKKKTFVSGENNFFKLSLGSLLRGTASISYERQFMDRFGVELSAGSVLWLDVMATSLSMEEDRDTLNYIMYTQENQFNSDFSNLYFSGSFRAYTNEIMSNSSYFAIYRYFAAIEIKQFKQTFEMNRDQFNSQDFSNRILDVQNFYKGVQFGYLVESDYNAIIQEASIGVGLITRRYDALYFDQAYYNQNLGYRFITLNEKKVERKPYFTIGYKIGLKF